MPNLFLDTVMWLVESTPVYPPHTQTSAGKPSVLTETVWRLADSRTGFLFAVYMWGPDIPIRHLSDQKLSLKPSCRSLAGCFVSILNYLN